jgi:DNA-binding transcriptional ArsR family regulator
MPLSQATVSQHLKVLKEAGLVCGRIDGKNSCYGLDPGGIVVLRATLDGLLGGLLADLEASAAREMETVE